MHGRWWGFICRRREANEDQSNDEIGSFMDGNGNRWMVSLPLESDSPDATINGLCMQKVPSRSTALRILFGVNFSSISVFIQ